MVRFQKTHIFPINVDDFIQLLGRLGVTLGSIWASFGVIGIILGVPGVSWWILMRILDDFGGPKLPQKAS